MSGLTLTEVAIIAAPLLVALGVVGLASRKGGSKNSELPPPPAPTRQPSTPRGDDPVAPD